MNGQIIRAPRMTVQQEETDRTRDQFGQGVAECGRKTNSPRMGIGGTQTGETRSPHKCRKLEMRSMEWRKLRQWSPRQDILPYVAWQCTGSHENVWNSRFRQFAVSSEQLPCPRLGKGMHAGEGIGEYLTAPTGSPC